MRALRTLCFSVLLVVTTLDAYCADVASESSDARAGSVTQSNAASQRDSRERVKRAPSAAPGNGLFESRVWTPPVVEQPRVAAPKPAPPVPPRFPYEFMGRLETQGKSDTIYLTRDSNVYSVTVGDVIEGRYQVLNVTPERLEVNYLPLGTKQQIALLSIVAAVQPQGITNTYVNPALPASVSVPVPAPFNLAPMFETGRPPDAGGQAPGGTGSQRSAEPAAANRGPAGNQAPAPGNAAAQSSTPATGLAVPGLVPTPVVVSPPSLSGFPPPATTGPAAGAAPNAAPTNPAVPGVQPGAPPNDPGVPGAMPDASGATSSGNVPLQVGVPSSPDAARR